MLPKDYLAIIGKNLFFIIGLGVIAAIAGGVFAFFQPATFSTSLSFVIKQTARQETPDYQYDQYYALQSSDLFAQTIVSWLESPEVATQVLKSSEVDISLQNIKKLSKFFKVKKESSQLVSVKFSAKTEEEAKKISTRLSEIINERSRALYQEQKNAAVFSAEAGSPLILQSKPNIILSILLGLAGGLVIAITLVFVREYFK